MYFTQNPIFLKQVEGSVLLM